MTLGVEITEMGWDLSIRAQSQRALAMNSVWLRKAKQDNSMTNHTLNMLDHDLEDVALVREELDDLLRNEEILVDLNHLSASEVDNRPSTKGGLCLAWQNAIHISLQNFSKRHIDVVLKDNERVNWQFTSFYGTLYAQDIEDSRPVLKNLYKKENVTWLACGDFNEIMMEMFRKALEFCQLHDVGCFGRWFTWISQIQIYQNVWIGGCQ
ncbi:hypothetical protein GOBAR_AA08445 [Gossypium barbadense]|uniref:Endonuclease/exonuclease/phosphatase domain-containing protein n=1 Tax=Gossypium barbadense TaxID=3634 RepID=A0A2P5Y9E4_GOSBA|nr:hypothetical protein GOBAR_AA08445 [Gossypium barbadense]